MTTTGEPPVARHRPWLVLTILCLGYFMIPMDTTILYIAVPEMSDGLGASLDQILWILNAYILVFAVLLITAGRLGDLYGPKRLFILGLLVFTVASTACGLAETPGQMIVARVFQGLGGALVAPQTLSMITITFPPAIRGAAYGVWAGVIGVATVIGPTFGGYLVTNWGWQYIFFVNVPVGLLAAVLAVFFVPNIRLNRRHRLDWTGTALVTTGLLLLVYGLIEGERHDWGRVWGPVTIPEIIGAGLLVLVVFIGHQYATRSGEPLIPFAIFRDRNYALMSFVTAASSLAMLGVFFPLIIYVQAVLGLSALQAGLALAPLSVMSMLAAPFAGRLADRIGGKWVLVTGLMLWSGGMTLIVWLARVDSGQWDLLPGLLVGGVGLGMTLAPLQVIAMRNVEPRMAGAASGFINTSRQLGGTIGAATVGALLQVQLARQLPATAREHAGALPEAYRDGFVAGVTEASSGSLHIGAGQSGLGAVPADVPEQARQVIMETALATFREAFTSAMKGSLVLPLLVLAVAALASLLIRNRQPAGPASPDPSGPQGPSDPADQHGPSGLDGASRPETPGTPATPPSGGRRPSAESEPVRA